MEMRILKHNFELFQFQGEFLKRSKNPLSIEFLSKALVFGYFKKNELVAGYIINSNFPLRYFQWVPASDQGAQGILSHYGPNQTSEICCIWMNKNKVNSIDRNLIYLSLAKNTFLYSKKWVFGGSITAKVAQIQKRVLPKIVYQGVTTLPDGPVGEIYCATKKELFIRTTLRLAYETFFLFVHFVLPKSTGYKKTKVENQI